MQQSLLLGFIHVIVSIVYLRAQDALAMHLLLVLIGHIWWSEMHLLGIQTTQRLVENCFDVTIDRLVLHIIICFVQSLQITLFSLVDFSLSLLLGIVSINLAVYVHGM